MRLPWAAAIGLGCHPAANQQDTELAAAVSTVGLSPDLAARTLAWPAVVEKARGSDTGLCAAVVEAQGLTSALAGPLADRRDAVFDVPTDDASFRSAVAILDARLDGLYLADGASTFYALPDWQALAGVASDPAAGALLTAASRFLGQNYPVWMRQTWDLGGCATLGDAVAPVDGLAASWAAAPDCLRAALRPPIEASLGQMARWACYCDDAATVRSAASALATSQHALEAAGGPAAMAPDVSETARFSDVCGG